MFSNNFYISNLVRSDHPLLSVNVDHPSLEFLFNCPDCNLKEKLNMKYVRNFNQANYININAELDSLSWRHLLNSKNINENVKVFYETLNKTIQNNVPLKRINNKFPPYFSQNTIKLILRKNKIHKKWKISKDESLYNAFRLLRSQSRGCINSNNKKIGRFVSKKRSNTGTPGEMRFGNRVARDGAEICELFCDFFQSVYVPRSQAIKRSQRYCQTSNKSLSSVLLTADEVQKVLEGLDEKKGAGPDNIPAIFAKKCSASLCIPLTLLFNQSLSSGVFPDTWKVSAITPIYKNGKKCDVKNYRPISKLCTFSKLFEKLVYPYIFNFVIADIIPEQYGFLKKRNLELNLMEYSTYIYEAFDSFCQVDVIFTDFSKAFDKISHEIMIQVLGEMGVCGDLLRWFESYLLNRSMFVALLGFCSGTFSPSSGVPQGSHLGPLLFVMYINCITLCFDNCLFLCYADDLKIFLRVNSMSDCEILQASLERLIEFCNENQLFLNPDQCSVLSFSRASTIINYNYKLGSSVLNRVTHIKDLGILFDSKMTFQLHIDKLVNDCNRTLGYIKRQCVDFNNSKTILTLYYSYVFSKLQFASVIWSPVYRNNVERLEKIQRNFLRFLGYKSHFHVAHHDYSEIRRRFKILELEKRRTLSDILTLFKIINNLSSSPNILSRVKINVPVRALRGHDLFWVPYCRTNYYQNAPLVRMVRAANLYCSDSELDFFQSKSTNL